MTKKSMIPGNTNNMLNKILFNCVATMDTLGTTSIYYDLSDKYNRERRLIKRDSEKLTFLDKVYKTVKKINIRLFEKARVIDKMERLDIVERIFSEEVFKVNNFMWNIKINDSSSYDSKEVLSNALESYDNFMAAINVGVISIESNVKIHDQLLYPIKYLNNLLLSKLQDHSATFSNYSPEIGDLSDKAQSSIIEEYAYIMAGQVPPNMFEEDVYFTANDDVQYFLHEYYLELKKIVLRLFNAYLYIEKLGKDSENLSKDEIIYLDLAYHYFTLSDEIEDIKKDDDLATDFASLPIFYKVFINNLIRMMIYSVNQKDEFDELNEEKRKMNPVIILDNDNQEEQQEDEEIVDFNDLTLKLLLKLKNPGKQE